MSGRRDKPPAAPAEFQHILMFWLLTAMALALFVPCAILPVAEDCQRWWAHRGALRGQVDAVQPDDLCVIMYTSGTTGAPKGVLLCHRHLISQQKAMSLMWDVDENDVYINYLPWHHSFGGLFERYMTLYNGCELCLDDSRGKDIERLIENWKAFDPTVFFSVPRVHDLLLSRCRENPEVEEIVFGGRLNVYY